MNELLGLKPTRPINPCIFLPELRRIKEDGLELLWTVEVLTVVLYFARVFLRSIPGLPSFLSPPTMLNYGARFSHTRQAMFHLLPFVRKPDMSKGCKPRALITAATTVVIPLAGIVMSSATGKELLIVVLLNLEMRNPYVIGTYKLPYG
ncbi:hypothetical protein K2173_020947 [Erythroxylum novogranatense]|uniref:Uncharacterized protein n=1 Tax=Erythroxylum novogranatense TaxID=1862640 RepID=A0AAV8TM39_9ROSI|nr:hypothetical protein K2173_020947 [Erythroxylum novogranatense]